MKKFFLGLVCGIVLTATTAAYASDTIQAYLFPAKFVINGETKNPSDSGYQTLNYDGHAYVPIRYIAENMGSKVAYDEVSQTITVDNGFNVIDINNREISAGHLAVTKEGNHSVINGKLYIGYFAWNHKYIDGYQSMTKYSNPEIDVTKTDVKGNLLFWDNEGELMERVPYEVKNASLGEEQILALQTSSQTDVSEYAVVTLESKQPTPTQVFGGLGPNYIDAENKVNFAVQDIVKTGDYSIVRGGLYSVKSNEVSDEAPITITFLDASGKSIGEAKTTLAATKTAQLQFAVLVGKGDFTNYKSITVKVGN
ncbi:stalk domain-containing protein [Paenibacillus aurantius]|uniref:Stalk domain-containing protein n=1 Tax=Paenibacillus aurantius TaxID=2918900 RepID=A0AA96L9Q6_9BACL|nr:stalk domain-containing protein [Paenibacillus aurantius]WNQ09621.1 stalk domain-containing protein [Paenibacillus aurantius]